MATIAFIDLEASGLGPASWPIEAGWCFGAGDARAYLIAPHPDWREAAWDPKAEALHGISLASLKRDGAAPIAVCGALNAALEGCEVYSDAPDWDGFWLYRLFSAARVRQRFSLKDFSDLFMSAAPGAFETALERAQAEAPRRHRVRDDVLHMRRLFELAAAPND